MKPRGQRGRTVGPSYLLTSLRIMSSLANELLTLPLAYLDPGTGAMILQLIAAGIAGVVVFFKFTGRRFMSLFRFGSKSEDEGGEE